MDLKSISDKVYSNRNENNFQIIQKSNRAIIMVHSKKLQHSIFSATDDFDREK